MFLIDVRSLRLDLLQVATQQLVLRREIWLFKKVNFLLERSNQFVSDNEECIILNDLVFKVLMNWSSLT